MSSEISTASSTVDFGAMNSSFGNYLQFPQQYMQFIEPSELKTPCQPALPNHEFSCPISGKLQHSPVGSEGSALSSTSKGSLTMSNSNTLRRLSIKQQILFAYSNHKRSTGQSGDSLVSFVNHLHSTVCQNLNCFCDRFHALLSHCDDSLTATSSNCNLVLYTNINSKLQQNSEDVNCIHVRKLNRTYSDNMLPPRKRVKEQHPFCPISSENRTTSLPDGFMSELCYPEVLPSLEQWPKSPVSVNSEAVDFVKSEVTEVMDSRSLSKEVKHAEETMPTNPKIGSASLLDYFSADQIKEHISNISSLKLSSGLRTSSEEKKFVQVDDVNSHHCQLCSKTELVLAPVPIYCSRCAARIKRGVIYYRMKEGNGVQACFCSSCYKLSRGARITFHGFDIPKAKLEKQKNNQTISELWIQCDKCERWQHQICALFNNRRNPDEKAVYLCPKCWLEYTESREKMPLPKATAFGARDLPITELSNHLEERLYRRLQQEREERARSSRMNLEQVPGPEDLVVREVVSVKKQVEVKKKLLDVFHGQNYSTEFPYRSKVILLFQKIEGVEVCLFGMFVQEFGSECGNPNQRCVYISYLDSVKYFRPETQTTTGEALRTFVYHEILIGYLESCKKRAFSTCYLWAFPPVKGEDYILYCHPDTQKTPKPDKLRQWYHSMLRKAARENIVVNCTNLYDRFFVHTTSPYCPKITAARLPYLDGYYWPDVAETVITNMEKQCGGNLEVELKKVMSQRALKAMGYSNPSGNAIKDILLMHKLGQTISAVKEDFIIVDLQFVCSQCQEVILSGSLWSCSQCKNFQLCERCQDSERMRIGENAHSFNAKDTHPLSKVMLDVPAATIDDEPIIESCLFQSRYSVLEFCVRNNYQFDTLRRAKHSSMMILHELERTMDAIGAACNIHQDKG